MAYIETATALLPSFAANPIDGPVLPKLSPAAR
jgi:hypothetical protein